jgi:AcrR family transcriptional regulator
MPKKLSPAQAERRRSLLAAASALGVEGGYDAITISAVAERAGVARATLYHYFRSKDDLLREATTQQLAEITADLQARPPTAGSPQARAADMLRRIVDWSLAKPLLFRAIISAWTSPGRGPAIPNRVLERALVENLRVVLGSESPGDVFAIARVLDHVAFAVLVKLSIGLMNRDEAVENLSEAAELVLLGAGESRVG